MIDLNQNGIPDTHEKWFLIVRLGVLVWSTAMLTTSYFVETKIDQTYMATMMTAAAASFGIKKDKGKEPPSITPERKGRQKLPSGFDK